MKRYVVLIAGLIAAWLGSPGMAQDVTSALEWNVPLGAPVALEETDPELAAALQAAREHLDTAARELAELHRQAGPTTGFDVQRMSIPMRLGLILGRPRGQGIEIMGVTPGGSAAGAGVESGDLLTSINGHALGGSGLEVARALRAATLELSPGDYLGIEYQRGDESRSAEIEVSDPQHPVAVFGAVSPGSISMTRAAYALGPGAARPMGPMRPMGVVLHDLNPSLGRYFGVDVGILVLNGGDDPDTLMPGDVVTELNGELIARQHELFAGIHAGEASVTVIRDGGVLTLPLQLDDLVGGMGVMRAVPVDPMRMMQIQGEGVTDVEFLINSDAGLVGDGL
jgi:hypothetical protein